MISSAQTHLGKTRVISRTVAVHDRYTTRIRGRPTFPLLVDAVACLLKGESPDLTWLRQHESLPVPSTP